MYVRLQVIRCTTFILVLHFLEYNIAIRWTKLGCCFISINTYNLLYLTIDGCRWRTKTEEGEREAFSGNPASQWTSYSWEQWSVWVPYMYWWNRGGRWVNIETVSTSDLQVSFFYDTLKHEIKSWKSEICSCQPATEAYYWLLCLCVHLCVLEMFYGLKLDVSVAMFLPS